MMQFNFLGVRVHFSFVFFAYVTMLLLIDKTGLFVPVFLSNAIHELGHCAALNFVGCKIIKIALMPGGCIITVPPYKRKKDEIFVLLCGPLINLVFGLAFILLWLIFNVYGCFVAGVINIGLGVFNLLPIKGLDASSVMYLLTYEKFRWLYTIISLTFTAAFILIFIYGFSLYGINLSVVMVTLYLVCCALFKI